MAMLNSLCILDLLLFSLLLGTAGDRAPPCSISPPLFGSRDTHGIISYRMAKHYCNPKVLCIINPGNPTDGYLYHMHRECHFSSNNLQDLEFIDRYVFNKLEFLRYNSTLNKFIGYTELGVKQAESFNEGSEVEGAHTNLDGYCRLNAEIVFRAILDKSVEPTVEVRSVIDGSHKHTSMLVCSAYDFYPRGIKMTWLRDGVEVTSDVTTTEELADGNWYYQIHSHLEYTPKSGERISCKVEHASLLKGKEVKWDLTLSEIKRNKVIIGASALVLGLIITIAGVVYYEKKSTGRILVPSSYEAE